MAAGNGATGPQATAADNGATGPQPATDSRPLVAVCHGADEYARTTYLMGTLLSIRVTGADRACAGPAVDAAVREVARLETVLSSWSADSEIGRLNASAPGALVELSPELAALLAEAGRWAGATAGAFDPAVGALIDAWDLRGEGLEPSVERLAAARALTGWDHLRLDGRALRRGPAGWWLDTGAFGKGAALRSAAAVLRAAGIERATLDFGGQLLVLGEAQQIAVAHPARREVEAARVRVHEMSVATTSSSERFVTVDGVRLGHVLDPRRGRPVAAWGSVTVLMPDPVAADALSTALYVMGPAAALQWAEQRAVAVLVLELTAEGVRSRWTRAMESWLIEHPGDLDR